MLEALKRFFDTRLSDAEPGHGDDRAAAAVELATAALMVEMMTTDELPHEDEEAEIRRLLQRHFHLDDDAVERLIALAGEHAEQSVSLHEFTHLIHRHFSVAQKSTVVEMLWRVAWADGRVDAHEDALVRKVADLLYLPQSEYVKAKDRAAPKN